MLGLVASHDTLPASPWVVRWTHLAPAGARVLDVACGSGRHVRWFAARGCRVTALDRDAGVLDPLRDVAEIIAADIENGPWPLAERRFDVVVVTNYLWRPLLAQIVASVGEAGVLVYETFADGQQSIGKPSNPAFLLRPGELLEAARGLRVIAYEDVFEPAPDRFVQRIVAVREAPRSAVPPRYLPHSPAASGAHRPGA